MNPKKPPVPTPLPCELIDDLFEAVEDADDLSAFEFVMTPSLIRKAPATPQAAFADDEDDPLDQALAPVDLVDSPTEHDASGASSTFMAFFDEDAAAEDAAPPDLLPQTTWDQALSDAPDGTDTVDGDIDMQALQDAIAADEAPPTWYTL